MNVSSITEQEEELVIDTIEGLVDFLAYAQDAFDDFEESATACPSEEICAPYLAQAQEAYVSLQSLVERHCKVLDFGGFLSQDDVEEIQTLYNKIISSKDSLLANLEPSHEEFLYDEKIQSDAGAAPEILHEAVFSHLYEDADEENLPFTLLPNQKHSSLTITNESEAQTGVTIRHISIDSETLRSALRVQKQKTEALLLRGEKMLHEYQEMTIGEDDDEDFKNGLTLYQQVESIVQQLGEIVQAITAHSKGALAEDVESFILQISEAAEEFDKNLTYLDKGLGLFFEEFESETKPVSASLPQESSKTAAVTQFEAYRPNLFTKNELRPAIEKVSAIPQYKQFLSDYFSSPGAFEAYLRREIDSREKISKFDSVFGIVRKSPFDTLLRDMTLIDMETFDHQPIDTLRHTLLHSDIQYEMYVDWMHTYEVMKEMVHVTPTMTFGELYVRAMVEDLMDKQLLHAE